MLYGIFQHWSRPLDPHSPTFDNDYTDLEGRLMQLNQIHTCCMGACLLYNGWSAIMKCKRCAPWPLSAENSIDERGNWVVKSTYSYVNNYQPDLLVMLWCNHDIKLLTNGEDTKNLTWYISNYTTKGQKSIYNMSSLITKYAAYQFADSEDVADSMECT